MNRSVCYLRFDGPDIVEHEMDVACLANSLLLFNQAVEQTAVAVYGKRQIVAVKVKGDFEKGSLGAHIVVDVIGGVLPLGKDILDCMVQLFTLKKFLGGEPQRQATPAGDGMIQIVNVKGGSITVNNLVGDISKSVPLSTIVGKLADELHKGSTSLCIETGSGYRETIEPRDHTFLQPAQGDYFEEVEGEYILEIRASQNDGKQGPWRFYDPENGIEFEASITDEQFLTDVGNRKYAFAHGDYIKVRLVTTKRIIRERRRTIRTIPEVIKFLGPETD